MVNKTHLGVALRAALKAGEAIMDVYRESNIEAVYKPDNSPVTEADRKASGIINEFLLPTGFNIINEEEVNVPFEVRSKWEEYWLVDPLDGTREFLKKNGEFTVNIAMIKNNFPVLGVIYAPDKGVLYYGLDGMGAYRLTWEEGVQRMINTANSVKIEANRKVDKSGKLMIVASRSHMDKETQKFINSKTREYKGSEIVGAGSSLKLCMVAEGTAHIYPRFGTTMEWDTAAGQAIAENAGASVLMWPEGGRVRYNKEDLRNPAFVVSALR